MFFLVANTLDDKSSNNDKPRKFPRKLMIFDDNDVHTSSLTMHDEDDDHNHDDDVDGQ